MPWPQTESSIDKSRHIIWANYYKFRKKNWTKGICRDAFLTKIPYNHHHVIEHQPNTVVIPWHRSKLLNEMPQNCPLHLLLASWSPPKNGWQWIDFNSWSWIVFGHWGNSQRAEKKVAAKNCLGKMEATPWLSGSYSQIIDFIHGENSDQPPTP